MGRKAVSAEKTGSHFALVALNQILPFSHRRTASARSQISCFVAGLRSLGFLRVSRIWRSRHFV